MQTTDVAQWKQALFARRRTHALFAVLFVTANVCYFASSFVSAAVLIGVGFVIEITSWIVLGTNDEHTGHPRGDLK